MKRKRWQKIEDVFHAALELSVDDRAEFLSAICVTDPKLRIEVESLLSELETADDILDDSGILLGMSLLAQEQKKSLIGETIGRYEIVKILGHGGMGVVYLAQDKLLERQAALKILPDYLTNGNSNVKRFQREAQAISAISHPNVTQIYEIGTAENLHFIALEYVGDVSLRRFANAERLSVETALDIALQIAEALSAAHSVGVVHRDIKPENVMLQEDGLVKVLDFGLAKLTACEGMEKISQASSFDTTPGLILGTIAYMSPEQVRGQNIDQTTDIWSWGVLVYELLTGKRPFDGDTSSDTIAGILKSEAAPPTTLNGEINFELERIVLKTLRKNQAERYQTAKELVFDLRRFKKNPPLEPEFNRKAPAKDRLPKRADFIGSRVKTHRGGIAVGLILMLFVALGARFWFFGSYLPIETSAAPIESIAVLPFINENATADNEFLADGLTESLINKLSQVSNLKVKARGSVFQYKGKTVKPQSVGSELSVQALILGHIVKDNGVITISLELIEANTGNQIWGNRYNGRDAEIIALQSQIVRDISDKLNTNLSAADERKLTKKYTENAEAYQHYLKGRFYWSKRTARDLQKSIESLQKAVALDPNFALAFAGLADSYVLLSGYAVSSPQESFPKAKEAALKAIEIDDTLAEAHCVLAYILFNYDWNFAESDTEMRRAIELNPNYATAHHWYGNANLVAMGELDKSIEELKRAQEIDPLSIIINADLGTAYLFARQPDNAVEQLKKTVEMDENFQYARTYLGRAYLMQGSYQKAVAEFQKAQTLGDDPRITMLLARTYIAWGKRSEALKNLNQLKKASKERYVSAYYFALIYAGLGEADEAFRWLEKAFHDREGRMTLIKVDPLLDNLRSDPRFQDLLKRVGLDK